MASGSLRLGGAVRRAADCRQIGAAAQAGRAEVGPAVGSLAGRAGGRVAYRLPAASSALRAASRRLDCRMVRTTVAGRAPPCDAPAAPATIRDEAIRLREGRDRSLLRRHPRVFEGGIASGRADAGETVRVQAADGRFLAWAAYSRSRRSGCAPGASTRPSASTRRSSSAASPARWRGARAGRAERRRAAGARRGRRPAGLIVDRYGESTLSRSPRRGAERWKPAIADAPLRATGARASTSVRTPACARWKACPKSPAAARRRADVAQVAEHGPRYEVDIAQGHKTGFDLDQRDSRRASPKSCATTARGRCPPATPRPAASR